MEKRLPKSIKKFIRKEKSRIRREVLEFKEQGEQISKLYAKIASEKRKVPHSARDIIRMRPSE